MFHARLLRAAARRAPGHAARLAAAALIAGAAGFCASASAAPEASPSSLAPMRFVRVASGGAACQPNCPEWISAEGRIVTGTSDALERVVGALGGRRLPIFINSAGGSVQDAMAMGRFIRAQRLAVAVAHTAIAPCPASVVACGEARGAAQTVGAYCASACTLVLAGGVERYVSPLSFVGVHQLTEIVTSTTVKRAYAVRYFGIAGFKWELSRTLVDERRSTATTKRAAGRGIDDDVAEYLSQMGVGAPVMTLTLATPERDVRWLTTQELADSRLATMRVEGASPIVEDEGAGGLGGEPVDARSGASLFTARSASPIAGGPQTIESAFAYRRGGGSVLATFVARSAAGGPPGDAQGSVLLLTLYPEGAQFHAARAANGEPARVSIPVRDFCALAHGGRAVVSLLERPAPQVGVAVPTSQPTAIDLASATAAAPLLEEACARVASADK